MNLLSWIILDINLSNFNILILDLLIKEQVVDQPEPEPTPAPPPEPNPPAAAPPAQEEADLTWEDKEDKLDAENIEPAGTDKKYQYKEGGSLDTDATEDPRLALLGVNQLMIYFFCFRAMEAN